MQVPGLILESKDEIRRFADAIMRKTIKKEHKKQLDTLKTPVEMEKYMELLKNERCIVSK